MIYIEIIKFIYQLIERKIVIDSESIFIQQIKYKNPEQN